MCGTGGRGLRPQGTGLDVWRLVGLGTAPHHIIIIIIIMSACFVLPRVVRCAKRNFG